MTKQKLEEIIADLMYDWQDTGESPTNAARRLLTVIEEAGWVCVPRKIPEEVAEELKGRFDNDETWGRPIMSKASGMMLSPPYSASRRSEGRASLP